MLRRLWYIIVTYIIIDGLQASREAAEKWSWKATKLRSKAFNLYFGTQREDAFDEYLKSVAVVENLKEKIKRSK